MPVMNAYETLLQVINPKYIGPLNFAKTVISYFISGSRRIVELNATFSPSGSYATVLDFLKDKATKDHKLPESADCIYFFDNNQIIARSWKVQFNAKPLISVVTTVACLVPPTFLDLQNCERFMPANWLSLHGLNNEENIPDTSASFRGERNDFLVKEIQNLSLTGCQPPPPKLRKAEFTSGTAKSHLPEPNDSYADIESYVTGKTDIILLDPVLVNPCSFISLEVVLDNIIDNANKKWVLVGCDGLP
ncbi:uncharacterized protein LOC123553344 [Mercenaria mercenaria]|uniref:uncharacterized protein LOC123553344 n=1 Tax=Mercenaria mercenaria TaxID=6596 RepID=UPI00234EC39F|nr:uncharacterized protein LOC123553344 [Mercenaria mercenaria]